MRRLLFLAAPTLAAAILFAGVRAVSPGGGDDAPGHQAPAVAVRGPAASQDRPAQDRALGLVRGQLAMAAAALDLSEARLRLALDTMAARAMPPSPFQTFALAADAAPKPAPRRRAPRICRGWLVSVTPARSVAR